MMPVMSQLWRARCSVPILTKNLQLPKESLPKNGRRKNWNNRSLLTSCLWLQIPTQLWHVIQRIFVHAVSKEKRQEVRNYKLFQSDFYPHDATLAWVLAMALCPTVSVCGRLSVSVKSQCSIKKDARIDLIFGMEASFDQSYTVL